MLLGRVFLFLVMALCLVACEFIEQNSGIDLQELIGEGIASSVEPVAPAADEDSDNEVGMVESSVSPQPIERQPRTASPILAPEQLAIQTALIESADAAESNFDYRLATMHYGRLVEMDPGDVESVLGFARNLRYSGNPKDSVLLLKGVLSSISSHLGLRIELVKAQVASGLMVEATDNTNLLLREAPGEWEVYALQGVLLDHSGKFDAAQSAY